MAEMFKTVIVLETGEQFDTKAEALDFLRKPKVLAELNKLTNSNSELNEWIYSHLEALEDIFSSGTIKRVTKAEHKELSKALEAIKLSGDKNYQFVIDNAGAIQDSFKWPPVKRATDEEKALLIKTSLMGLTENSVELTDWIMAQQEKIFEASEAGKIKKEVSPKATEGLEKYRKMLAEKKVLQDMVKEGVEGAQAKLDAFVAQVEAEKQAAIEAAKK